MKFTIDAKTRRPGLAAKFVFAAAFIGMAGMVNVFGQSEAVAGTKVPEVKATVIRPVVSDLRGVTIGMTADDVKSKLGKAKMTEDFSLYYDFGDGESMQISLDSDKKVRMVAAMYIGKKVDAPEYAEIFGPAAELKPAADGRIYNVVHYPESGFWLAYNYLMAGDDPMTTVTMQEIK